MKKLFAPHITIALTNADWLIGRKVTLYFQGAVKTLW